MPVEPLARSAVIASAPDPPSPSLRRMNAENAENIGIRTDEMAVGIVTDQELAVRGLGAEIDSPDQTAENVMTDNPSTAVSDTGFYEAANREADRGIRRLPVIRARHSLELSRENYN